MRCLPRMGLTGKTRAGRAPHLRGASSLPGGRTSSAPDAPVIAGRAASRRCAACRAWGLTGKTRAGRAPHLRGSSLPGGRTSSAPGAPAIAGRAACVDAPLAAHGPHREGPCGASPAPTGGRTSPAPGRTGDCRPCRLRRCAACRAWGLTGIARAGRAPHLRGASSLPGGRTSSAPGAPVIAGRAACVDAPLAAHAASPG